MSSISDEESARIGYETCINLWTYEGNILWAKFNALLVANSLVLAAYGFSGGSDSALPDTFLVALPVAGIVICLVWAQLMKRGFDNYKYWIFSARELEEGFLAPTNKVVSRGGALADGSPITVLVGGRTRTLRMSGLSQVLRAEYGSYAIVLVFLALWVFLAFS